LEVVSSSSPHKSLLALFVAPTLLKLLATHFLPLSLVPIDSIYDSFLGALCICHVVVLFFYVFLVFCFPFVYLFLGFFTNSKEGVDKVFDVMKVAA
jgi:hypothetical protein